jgi:GT2 family glycosyltransferase
VLVDGGSGDGSANQLANMVAGGDFEAWTSFLPLGINGGFGWANNQAILSLARSAQAPEFLYLVNPDAYVLDGAVAALVRDLRDNPKAGAAGSRLLNSDRSPVASAFRFLSPARELIAAAQSEKLGSLLGIAPLVSTAGESSEVDWVTGASFMLRATALKESQLFDDGFFLYFEEVELMHRLRAHGWTVRHVPDSLVVHSEGASTGLGPTTPVRSLPGYWYNSRRRYFALTGGRGAVIRANLAFLAGKAAHSAKSRFRTSSGVTAVRARDLFRFGVWPRTIDTIASAPAWGDQPGRLPFWMTAQ